MNLPLPDWLAVVEHEYLDSYVPAGGAAVRFAIAAEALTAEDIHREMASLALRHNLMCFSVDGGETRIHMIDHLFHAVARQVDWDALAGDVMRGLLGKDGFLLPVDSARCTYAEIAEMNGTSDTELRRRVRVLLHEHVENDYALVHEFRSAMLRLCQAYLEASKTELVEIEHLYAWLRGELRSISSLKSAGIFQKVGRNLARDMFLSLAHWIRMAGKPGSMLILDISRYALERRYSEPDGLLFHSTTAVLDAYEVLREFVDAVDDLEGCVIVVVAPTAFLTDEKRGLVKYAALRLRIWDEVRDRSRANPLSALVRLSGTVS